MTNRFPPNFCGARIERLVTARNRDASAVGANLVWLVASIAARESCSVFRFQDNVTVFAVVRTVATEESPEIWNGSTTSFPPPVADNSQSPFGNFNRITVEVGGRSSRME